ncbi:MAG: ABC transporter ATP-binding protein [Eubacteriaceae bacterium]
MIKVKNLTQVYKSGKGIFDVSFEIKEGEVFGFLGPNGAGKTTAIRNLMGFVNASKGEAFINGLNCRTDAAKLQEIIGYLPGEMAFFENMTGIEFLEFMGHMRRTKNITRRDELIELFDIDTKSKIKKMSKGMKQKIGIITAFMHDPQILILDEPTSGLDPFMQNVFIKLIEEEKNKGKTIMMSTHIFEEVQRSCDRAGIIREGILVATEDIKSLNEMNKKRFEIILHDAKDMEKLISSGYQVDQVDGLMIVIEQSGRYDDFFKLLSTCNIKSFDVKHQSLEEIFMKYYGKEGV